MKWLHWRDHVEIIFERRKESGFILAKGHIFKPSKNNVKNQRHRASQVCHEGVSRIAWRVEVAILTRGFTRVTSVWQTVLSIQQNCSCPNWVWIKKCCTPEAVCFPLSQEPPESPWEWQSPPWVGSSAGSCPFPLVSFIVRLGSWVTGCFAFGS